MPSSFFPHAQDAAISPTAPEILLADASLPDLDRLLRHSRPGMSPIPTA